MATAEASIVANVETYLTMSRQGLDNDFIIEYIENNRSFFAGTSSTPPPKTIGDYIRYRVQIEFSNDSGLSDESIAYSIREARRFFGDL